MRQKSALHGDFLSGAEAWTGLVWQSEVKAIEEELHVVVGLGVTRESEGATVGSRELHIDHLKSSHFFECGAGSEAGSEVAQARLQSGVQSEGDEADEDVGFRAILELVVDRTDAQIAFEVAKGFLDADELKVAFPKLCGIR